MIKLNLSCSPKKTMLSLERSSKKWKWKPDVLIISSSWKSFEILKSALTIFTSNTKLMFLMVFSIIPFFLFLTSYEIKLQKTILAAPGILENLYTFPTMSVISLEDGSFSVIRIPEVDNRMEFLFDVLQLCLLYVGLFPLLELLSMTTVIQIAAKVYAGEKPCTLKDVFYSRINLKGVVITYGYVHLLSFLTLVGLSWIIGNHLIFTGNRYHSLYHIQTLDLSYFLHKLSIGIHTMFFVALLYKYLDWSAFWNMTMVISVLEEESGLDAFGMTNFYGKHCKSTGFQLMLGFVGLNTALRLLCGLCLYVSSRSSKSAIFGVTVVVMGMVCLGNLVKWVAFVLYYFDCKQQTMEKKNDVEIGKAVNVG